MRLNAVSSAGDSGDRTVETSAPRFAYLMGASVPDHLEAASCVYLDGISPDCGVCQALDAVEEWFSRFGEKARVVQVTSTVSRRARYTMKSLRAAAEADEAALTSSIAALKFYPRGRRTEEDTWHPGVYAAISLTRPAAAFFSVNRDLPQSELLAELQRATRSFRPCAAYGFWFPIEYSPLAYFWGLAVVPSQGRAGSWDERKRRRLSHWRDNTDIGIANPDGRCWFGACDGYVRDVFPMMLLSEAHERRLVSGVSLIDRIRQDDLGVVTGAGDKSLCRIPREKLAVVQTLLDNNDVTLSGRRLEGMITGDPRTRDR